MGPKIVEVWYPEDAIVYCILCFCMEIIQIIIATPIIGGGPLSERPSQAWFEGKELMDIAPIFLHNLPFCWKMSVTFLSTQSGGDLPPHWDSRNLDFPPGKRVFPGPR